MGVTRDYLDHHQLQQRIQSLIQDVLREQPENPYKYMLTQLRNAKGGGANDKEQAIASSAASPSQDAKNAAPRPPEGPKPAVSRGRPAGSKTKTVDYPSEASISITYESYQPSGEEQVAARFSMTNLLRMPRCQKAAEQSLRSCARQTGSRTMARLIMNSTKEKLVSEIARTKESDVRDLARASMNLAARGAAVLNSPEYHRAVNSWARYVAYKGADRLIGAGDGRRISLPTPIVFLEGQGSSWGSWLGADKKRNSTRSQ